MVDKDGSDADENDDESHISDEGQGHLRGDDPAAVEEWAATETDLEEEHGIMVSSATEDEEPARKRKRSLARMRETSAMQRNRTNRDLMPAPCDLDEWAFDLARACVAQPKLKDVLQEKVQTKKKIHLYTDWSGAVGGEQAFLDVITAIDQEFGIDLSSECAAIRATDKNNKCKFLLSACAESWAKPRCVQTNIMDRVLPHEMAFMVRIVETYQKILEDEIDSATAAMTADDCSNIEIKTETEKCECLLGDV